MRTFWGVASFSCVLLLAGCSGTPIGTTILTSTGQGSTLKGEVHGGQQPISGAAVYLYAANTTGYGSASLSLLTSGTGRTEDVNGNYYVTTAADGTFGITGDYTCPSATSQVYLYSVGGSSGSGTNSAAGLLAGLGACGNLATGTFVMVNEVSTIATAYAISGFATDATHVSSSTSTSGQTGIANAFTAITNLEAVSTGAALATTPAANGGNGIVPQAEIDTLANILAGCINSTGSGSSGCTTLLGTATNSSGAEPADTATAAINIAHSSGANTSALYGLATASAPFQPTLTGPPNDFTIAINYTGGGLSYPQAVAIDASGNVWVQNGSANSVSLFSPVGAALSGSSGFTGAGINEPASIAVDTAGHAWVADAGSNSLSELSYSGGAISGSSVYSGSNLNSPAGIAIDGSNNVWVANYGNNTLSEFNSSGSPTTVTSAGAAGLNGPDFLAIEPAGSVLWATDIGGSANTLSRYGVISGTNVSYAVTGGGISAPYGIAIDAGGNAWVPDLTTNQLSEVSSAGEVVSGSPYSGGGLNRPQGIAIDGAGNIWVGNNGGNSISEFGSSGIAITGSSGLKGGGLSQPVAIAIDGSGNLWAPNNTLTGNSITEFVGLATPVVTPLATNLEGTYAVNPPFYNPAVSLPAPGLPSSTLSLPPAAVGVPYSGFIGASGNGGGPYVWTVNGAAVPGTGTQVSIGDGFYVYTSGGPTLEVTGTPTSATSSVSPLVSPRGTPASATPSGDPLTFSAEVSNGSGSNVAGPDLYSISVAPGSGQIGGQVSLYNNCLSYTVPTFTLTLSSAATGQPVATTTTNSAGSYSFPAVPAGTYNITPSVPGAAISNFFPPAYTGVVVSSGTGLASENFAARVGYDVFGTLSYTGTAQTAGQVYVVVNNGCGGSVGTSVPYPFTSGGFYAIRGVPPGPNTTYTVQAYMDPSSLGQGQQNVIDPTGSSSSFTVNDASVSGVNVSLKDPVFATPSSNPSFEAIPMNGGWVFFYSPPQSNGEEAANQYSVQWALPTGTDSLGNPYCALIAGGQFEYVAGSHTFSAIGGGATVWILNNTSMGAGAFNGGAYCFQARAYNTLDTSAPNPGGWADNTDGDGNVVAVAPGASNTFCATNCTTVSGAVTIPSGVSIKPGAPLYIGYYQETATSSGPVAIYTTEVANPVSGGAGNNYQMTIPNGSGYVLFGILDQNNNGLIDVGDLTNIRANSSNGVSFSGGAETNQNLTLPATNSAVTVQTSYVTSAGSTPSYSIAMSVVEANKLPVAVTLSSTTASPAYMMMPLDLGQCTSCGTPQFNYSLLLPGTPSVGDAFDYTVTYSDGTEETGTVVNGAVTAFGSTGALVGPGDVATNLETAGTNPLEPNFTWTFPANPSDYLYTFEIEHCSSGCTAVWQIPNYDDSNLNGFGYSETETSSTTGQITWGIDPTGDSTNTPAGPLSSANDYAWWITVTDSNGNTATSQVQDNNP